MNGEIWKNKNLLDLSSLPALITDKNFKIEYANKEGANFFNLSPHRILSKKIFDLFPRHREKIEALPATLAQFQSIEDVFDFETKGLVNIQYKVQKLDILSPEGHYFFEFKKEAQAPEPPVSLETMGKCTGSLAHSISNPLSVLKIHCDNFELLAKSQLTFRASEVVERLQKMNRATDRLTVYNDRLKTFSKLLTSEAIDSILEFIEEEEDSHKIPSNH